MEIKNKLTVTRGVGGGGVTGGKKGNGASKSTGIEDSWAWTVGIIDWGSEENWVGERNGEGGRTAVTEQQ